MTGIATDLAPLRLGGILANDQWGDRPRSFLRIDAGVVRTGEMP
jgi:hypothetical protein